MNISASHLHVEESAGGAAMVCARHIAKVLRTALEARPAASLAVSGGKTPAAMFALLAKEQIEWQRVHVFWVDERCVPPTGAESNFRMTVETLVQPAGIPSDNLHRIEGEREPEAAARRIVGDIREHFESGPGETPSFDVVQFGVGDDGHTASLFPGDPLINDRLRLAAAARQPSSGQWRVTMLPALFEAARHAVVLACGGGKAEALQNAFDERLSPLQCPARLIASLPGGAHWFLDRAAAARLD